MWPLARFVGADPATGPKEAEKPGRRGQNWSQCHFAAARTLGEWRRRPQALSSLWVTRPQACRTGRSRCADRQQLSLAQALPPLRGARGAGAPMCTSGPEAPAPLTALREAWLRRGRGRRRSERWQQHRTFLNRQLWVRTRWDWPVPYGQASVLIAPGHWCGHGPLAAHAGVRRRCHNQGSVPAGTSLESLGKRAQRWGLEGPGISSGPRTRSQQTVLPFLPKPRTLDIRVWLWPLHPVHCPQVPNQKPP